MISVQQFTEGAPDNYPTVSGLSDAALALDQSAIWRRIEHHIAHRFSPRSVTLVLLGDGEWRSPLTPFELVDSYQWVNSHWSAYPLELAALGIRIPAGQVLINGTVGHDHETPLPGDVAEAFKRYAEYVAAESSMPVGASQHAINMGSGVIQEQTTRSASHMAKALVNSGAADLLRPYRRVT